MSTFAKHYIFGYGSLINSLSRAVTGESGAVLPVKIAGYERSWSVMSPDFGMSSVAVVQCEGAFCNGVLVEVPESEIPNFDLREQGYQRSRIESHQIKSYQEDELPQGTLWIYHACEIVPPTDACPIALSYADVIMAGCIEHGDDFALEFISLTKGWEFAALNDRVLPRYPRVQAQLCTHRINKLVAGVINLTDEQLAVPYDS
ncbi:gamma-glutamylcyclotransferase family protein [Neptunomonas sp.]|uniref:gamma-glutamylcyclotransferase family protein n=1 Tax=Neptunomonas sp. TaxID=1971898 RepID=UPI00260041EE|nr:gamma-glutamylcyclotransferase family protein [Neptunomonas sp.]